MVNMCTWYRVAPADVVCGLSQLFCLLTWPLSECVCVCVCIKNSNILLGRAECGIEKAYVE